VKKERHYTLVPTCTHLQQILTNFQCSSTVILL